MASSPIFPGTMRIATTTLNSPSDRSGNNTTQLFVAGSSGSFINKIDVITSQPTGTTLGNKSFRVFIKNGSTLYLFREILTANIVATGISQTTYNNVFIFADGLILSAGQEIWVGQSTSSTSDTANDISDWICEVSDY